MKIARKVKFAAGAGVLLVGCGAIAVMSGFAGMIFGMPPLKDTSWVARQFKDVAYAPLSKAERLDLYLPNDGNGPFPVIVAIHGGAFLFGDKGDGQQNGAIEGLHHGYAVASINYRLAGEAPFPAAVQDVKAAIRYLRANAETYHLDPTRIIAWGDSAGAYMAVMAGVTGATAEFDDVALGNPEQSSAIEAVVDWFGPIDFAAMDEQLRQSGNGTPNHSSAGSPESRFLGQTVGTASADVTAKANAMSYISAGAPPFLIQHGEKDPTVPTQQSLILGDRLKAVLPADRLEIDVIPGAGHGGPQFESPANLAKVFAFLDRALPH